MASKPWIYLQLSHWNFYIVSMKYKVGIPILVTEFTHSILYPPSSPTPQNKNNKKSTQMKLIY